MKFITLAYSVATAFLFLDYASAKDSTTFTKVKIAQRMSMPELLSTSNAIDLKWFRNRMLLSEDKVFFHSVLMNELKKSDSFPRDRQILAKYCLRTALNMTEAQQRLLNVSGIENCIKILVKKGDFTTLIYYSIRYGHKCMCLLNNLDSDDIQNFAEFLWASPLREQFLNVLASVEASRPLNINLYGHFIAARDVPDEFYMETLVADADFALAVANVALTICLGKLPFDYPRIQKVERAFDSVRRPIIQQFATAVKDAIRVITAPDDITSAGLGINTANMPINARISQLANALNHGKYILARETIPTFSNDETLGILKSMFASANLFKPNELKVASKLYGMLPEEVRRPVHETEEYLKAAVQYLRLERMQTFSDGDYKYSLTFRASPEQVASGYLEEMTYFARRNSDMCLNLISKYGLDIKFTSAEAIEAIMSQDLRSIFPEWTDDSFFTSKDTLNLITGSRSLIDRIAELGFKIAIKEIEVLEFLKETAIENVPIMRDVLRENFVKFEMLSKINDGDSFRKLEKFTGAKISDIVKNALELSNQSEMGQAEYFMIRNALVYWADGPMIGRLNELPLDLKNLLLKELPDLSYALTIAQVLE